MSCPAANSIVKLNVSMGSLPDGFCPASLQELGNAIAARLIVTPNQANSTFASGSIEPPNNQGPWFKNCNELFVWDDATARYRPITKSGFTFNKVYDASDTFIVPDNIYYLMVEVWGAGGGGANTAGSQDNGGGGAGAYGLQFFNVTPTQAVALVVGGGGAGGLNGASGGTSSFLTLSCGGGGGAKTSGITGWSDPGIGGTVTGAQIGIRGGMGNAGSGPTGIGVGGHSPNGGAGGMADYSLVNMNGVAPGGGGCGGVYGTNLTATPLPGTGGNGANGRVVVWY